MFFWKMEFENYHNWMPAVSPAQYERFKRPYAPNRMNHQYVIESPLDFEVGDEPVTVYAPFRGGTDMDSTTMLLVYDLEGRVSFYTMEDAVNTVPFNIKVREPGLYREGCILGHFIILNGCVGGSETEPDYSKNDMAALAARGYLNWN